jgi:hypothetical protein|tara:strand:- start:558 stop:731 length:174 start_codon:yes stop_codon:yes gene_type:complete
MTTPEPEFISRDEYVDPGDKINSMFEESFGEMRERVARREATGDQEEADQEDEESEE